MITLVITNTVLIFIIAAVVFFMVRQIGILVAHVAPSGYREDNAGPRKGEILAGQSFDEFEDIVKSSDYCIVVFGSKDCHTCQSIKNGGLNKIAIAWKQKCKIIYLYDELLSADAMEKEADGKVFLIRSGGRRHRNALAIPYVPFAIIVDSGSRVLAKGLVNHPSHVESLIEIVEKRSKLETNVK